MQISVEEFKKMLPITRTPEIWAPLLSKYLAEAKLTEPNQVALFLGQVTHESSNFNVLVENLNYGRPGLLSVFGKYFNEGNVDPYVRQPEMIANRVYANRMGNGDEASGDGWKFRGEGILQVTGKYNHGVCSQYLFNDDRLLDTPELLQEPEYALRSALWFWDVNNLSNITDVTLLTRRVNGGTTGLADRIARTDSFMEILTKG